VWERSSANAWVRMREAKGMTQTDLARRTEDRRGLPFHQQTIPEDRVRRSALWLNEAIYRPDAASAVPPSR